MTESEAPSSVVEAASLDALRGRLRQGDLDAPGKLAVALTEACEGIAETGDLKAVERILDELRALRRENSEPAISTALAQCLYHAFSIRIARDVFMPDDVMDELGALAAKVREFTVTERYAAALSLCCINISCLKDYDSVEYYLEPLRTIVAENDKGILRKYLAEALYEAIEDFFLDEQFDKGREQYLEELRTLAQNNDEDNIQELFAAALGIVCFRHHAVGDFAAGDSYLAELRMLATAWDLPLVRLHLADTLERGVQMAWDAENFMAAEIFLAELRALTLEYEETDLLDDLASCLEEIYERATALQKAEVAHQALDELRGLAAMYDGSVVTRSLAGGLADAHKGALDANSGAAMDFLNELQELFIKNRAASHKAVEYAVKNVLAKVKSNEALEAASSLLQSLYALDAGAVIDVGEQQRLFDVLLSALSIKD